MDTQDPEPPGYDGQLAAALAKLAAGCRTARDVARKLADAGCRGERGRADSCPVCAWLNRHVTVLAAEEITTGLDIAEVLHRNGTGQLVTVGCAEMPDVLASFMVAFDVEDQFPDLERRAQDDGEWFEVYPTSDSCAYSARPFGDLGHDEAMAAARQASEHGGPYHCVERVTVVDGLVRRNRIAEFRDGELAGDLK